MIKANIFSMIKANIIDDEQHCIEALTTDLSKNCGNVEVIAKCVSAKEGILSIKKYKPQPFFSMWKCHG